MNKTVVASNIKPLEGIENEQLECIENEQLECIENEELETEISICTSEAHPMLNKIIHVANGIIAIVCIINILKNK
ncbi:MAG: hypothetical protein CBB97_21820 [Candidatus Endolissoclinum sp. TMED37]|nr:MAG: hypothetical protein CBB97_21820 [Candidatus Endolissoclinum sp. TMED37]|tara:strand:+ start:855 stop:1082 length:228 start_codon:yes stop_codon:yes gene_type:complete